MKKNFYTFLAVVAVATGLRGEEQSHHDPVTKKLLEDRVLGARRQITSCYLEIATETTTHYDRTSQPAKYVAMRKIWWTPERMRIDKSEMINGKAADIPRVTICRNYDNDGRYLRYEEGNRKEDVQIFRTVEPGGPSISDLFDLRTLGYTLLENMQLNSNTRLDDYFGSMLAKDAIIEENVISGVNLFHYRYSPRKDVEIDFVIRPDCGWTPSEIIFADQSDGMPLVTRNAIKTILYPDNIWYVKEYTLTKNLDESGGKVQEHAVVKDAWFNRELRPEIFTYDGIGIKPGTLVRDYESGEDVMYTGDNRVISHEAWDESHPVAPQPLASLPGRVNYWLVAACIVFAIIAALLLTRACRHRAAST